jgi:hypothetical protein
MSISNQSVCDACFCVSLEVIINDESGGCFAQRADGAEIISTAVVAANDELDMGLESLVDSLANDLA